MLESANSFFQAVFLVTFCAMVIDGRMDQSEIALARGIYEDAPIQQPMDYRDMINHHINIANQDAHGLLQGYFQRLKDNELSNEDSFALLVAIDTLIKADGKITPEERQFLNLTQAQMYLSPQDFKTLFPDIDRPFLFLQNENLERPEPEEISVFVEALDLPEFDPIKEESDES